MAEIDSLLAKFIEQQIMIQFGNDLNQTIKNRIFERYGVNLTDALRQYEPFDKILREFFGKAADGMIRQLFEKICFVKKTKQTLSLEIRDKIFANLLLESYGHKDKKAILLAVSSSALSISKILKQARISSQTTGYRLINDLIKDGLLVESGFDLTTDGKKTHAYISPIKKINIILGDKNIMCVTIEFSDELIAKSGILNTVITNG
ncbi:MAG TPA: transcriptional regulator [Candidatus Nitrosotenuis sp.]|nr:transcriptional regulator [Candidatus Nitrosotenuis sp.]